MLRAFGRLNARFEAPGYTVAPAQVQAVIQRDAALGKIPRTQGERLSTPLLVKAFRKGWGTEISGPR